jgi:hypothetical protein
MMATSPTNHENTPNVWVTVTKPVWIDSQTVMGDDAGIEARSSNIQNRQTSLDTSFDNDNR